MGMDNTHLNKIVEYLLEDTIIHYDHTTIQLIGSDIEYDIEFLSDSNGFFDMMWDILKKDYGLNSNQSLYVYGNYLYQINKKIKLFGSINESVDNKEKYLDKIVQFMVDDTFIDYDREEIRLPFFLISFFFFPKPFVFRPFSNYVKDTYGLTGEEIIYVWEKYKSIVDDKINQ